MVATIIGHSHKDLVEVTVDVDGDAGDAVSTIIATAEHPFWVDDHGRLLQPAVHGLWGEAPGWYDAADLDPGDQLRTPTGDKVRVVDLRGYTATTTVHNLTINGVHTYYVVAGATPVLIHNASCWSTTKKKSSVENAYGHWDKHKSEFPNLNNAKEYVEAATNFLRSPNPNVLTRTRENGGIVRFNPATDEFGVMGSSGVPRTYFKPNPESHGYATNMDYFNDQ